MISSFRAPLSLAESPPPPASSAIRSGAQQTLASVAPVTGTLRVDAVQQSPPKLDAGERHLVEARMTNEHNAAAAAEAAREAYIKASIAAGISPLPLP